MVLWVSFIIFISDVYMYYLIFIFVKLIRVDFIGLWLILQFFVDNVLSYVFDNLKSFKILFNNFCGLFKVYV